MRSAANDKPSLPALGVSTAFPPGQALSLHPRIRRIDRSLIAQGTAIPAETRIPGKHPQSTRCFCCIGTTMNTIDTIPAMDCADCNARQQVRAYLPATAALPAVAGYWCDDCRKETTVEIDVWD
jgi:hypothetical protein